jgi:hypothetical protein
LSEEPKMYFRLVGEETGCIPWRSPNRDTPLRFSNHQVLPYSTSDHTATPFSPSDQPVMPLSPSDQSEILISSSDRNAVLISLHPPGYPDYLSGYIVGHG